jgi:hypothetical protein
MLRHWTVVAFGLFLTAGLALGDEYKGTIKSVDTAQGKLILTADSKDHELAITDATQLVNAKGKEVKSRDKGLKALRAGAEVTVTSEKKDGKELATRIQLPAKKKKS